MNRKTNLYVLAAMLFVALLATPAVSATSHETETADGDNENTVDASKNTAYGYMAIGAGLAIGLAGINVTLQ